MGFNLSGRYLTAINLLLIAGIAYFAALAVNDLIAGRLAGAVKIAPAPAAIAPPPEQTFARSHYDQIVDRDIFNPPSEAEPAPVVAEDLHLKLLGTSIQTRNAPWAIIEDERNARQALYRLGDDIPDAGKLAEVDETRVFIERQGKRVELDAPANPLPGPLPSVSPEPERPALGMFNPGGVQPMGGNRYVVDRATVDGSTQNLMSLLTQMRAVPDIEDGRARGFKLSEIQPGSLFQQMGLADGDVVTSIEGQPLNDPNSAMQLLSSLRYRQSVGLSVMRNGSPMQFRYDIR